MSEQVETPSDDEHAPPVRGKFRVPRAVTEAVEANARSIIDFFQTLGVSSDFSIQIYRVRPTVWQGKEIAGHIETIEELINEDEMKGRYGGGTYQLKVTAPDQNGKRVFLKAHTVKIAGDPILQPGAQMQTTAPLENESTKLSQTALNVMAEQVREARADRGRPAMDPDAISRAIEAATAPMRQTIEALQRELTASRESADRARQQPPDPVRDQIMNKLLDDDTSRMTALRITHQSEIAQLKQSMIDTENRLRDQHERALERSERERVREVDMLKSTYESQIATLRVTYESQISSLRESHARETSAQTMLAATRDTVGAGEVKRLERENIELRAENKELRAKKEKGPLEMFKEVNELKELVGGDGDGEEKSTIAQVAEIFANSQIAVNLAKKLGAAEAPPQQPQLPPPHVPYVGQDGRMYVHDGQGNVAEVQPAQQAIRRRKVRPAAPTPPPAPPPPPEGSPPEVQQAYVQAAQQHQQAEMEHALAVKEAQLIESAQELPMDMVHGAVQYLEGAFRNNPDNPLVVAQSLRSQALVPESVIKFLREHGVDVLMDRVARLDSSSPLSTQAGRNWIRKVEKGLLG